MILFLLEQIKNRKINGNKAFVRMQMNNCNFWSKSIKSYISTNILFFIWISQFILLKYLHIFGRESESSWSSFSILPFCDHKQLLPTEDDPVRIFFIDLHSSGFGIHVAGDPLYTFNKHSYKDLILLYTGCQASLPYLKWKFKRFYLIYRIIVI